MLPLQRDNVVFENHTFANLGKSLTGWRQNIQELKGSCIRSYRTFYEIEAKK